MNVATSKNTIAQFNVSVLLYKSKKMFFFLYFSIKIQNISHHVYFFLLFSI